MTKRRGHGAGLGPEDEALWQRVTRHATPLHPKARMPLHQPKPLPLAHAPVKQKPQPLHPFRMGQSRSESLTSVHLAPGPSELLAHAPVRMDRKAYGNLTRGRLSPEARIDLHGMVLAVAHPALNRFIVESHARGLRLVLVITGKGKDRDDGGPIPQRMGVLRHHVPQWLAMPPLGALVLQVAQAHQKHGGAGAYYVYLRRSR
ncbi:MAG: Smr/MutS family protein [Paracoccaceae bacterium]